MTCCSLVEERPLYWVWGVALKVKPPFLFWIWLWNLYGVWDALSDWFLVNRRGFGPQGVKQVVIFRFAFVWIKGRITFIIIKGNAWLNPHWLLIISCFRPLGGSTRWELAVDVGQWEPTIFKGKKLVRTETLSHSHPKYKSCFGMEILDTRPPPWAWGATNVPYLLGSTHGLGSCKRSERNQLIPSKPHFLNFPISCMGLNHA